MRKVSNCIGSKRNWIVPSGDETYNQTESSEPCASDGKPKKKCYGKDRCFNKDGSVYHSVFEKQADCITRVEQDRQNPQAVTDGYSLWAVDRDNEAGTKYYIHADIETMANTIDQMPMDRRNAYEDIPEKTRVKPYIDDDWYDKDEYTGATLSTRYQSSFIVV